MKKVLVLGVLGLWLGSFGVASAGEPNTGQAASPDVTSRGGEESGEGERPLSQLQLAGYDFGQTEANDFCNGIKKFQERSPEQITKEFARYCKKGFDDLINSNVACKQRLEQQNRYSEMWETRQQACE